MKQFLIAVIVMVIFLMDGVIALEKRMLTTTSASDITEITSAEDKIDISDALQTNPVSKEQSERDCINGTKNGVRCTVLPNGAIKKSNTTSEEHSHTDLEQLIEEYKDRKLCLDYGDWEGSLKVYDPERQICCDGLFNKTKPSEECCNGHLIDGDKKICCGDDVVDKANDTVGCCRTSVYFTNDTLCCNGSLHPKPKYAACCGDRIISEISEICCQGRAFPKSGHDLECCESTAYDKERQVCCNGTVQSTDGIEKNTGACCGTVFYDSRCYTCNAGAQLDALQDTLRNDLGNQTCCHGKIKVINEKRFCCENGTADRECLLYNDQAYIISSQKGRDSLAITAVLVFLASLTVGLSLLVIMMTMMRRCRERKLKENEESRLLIENGITSEEDIRSYPEMPPNKTEFSPNLSVHPERIVLAEDIYKENIIVNDLEEIMDNDIGNVMNSDPENVINNDTKKVMKNDTEMVMNNETENMMDIETVKVMKNETEKVWNNDRENVINTDPENTMNYNTENTVNYNTENTVNYNTENTVNYNTENTSKDTDDHITKTLYEDQGFATFVEMIEKKQPIYRGNELRDHYKDIACQTVQKENSCNRRTIFGNPFEHSCILDMKNPTFVMPWSEVKVRLPDSILQKHPIEMHGTSFDSITSIHEKIKISDDEMVASPAVEYVLTGVSALEDYAVVIMPFLGNREDIRVWKFLSDDGMQTKVEPFEVPIKSKENVDQPLFYEIDGNNVRIFTKSFSGFLITDRRHNRDPCVSLHAYLFGSHKRFPPENRHEIRLMLYIADEILDFKDFKRRLFEKEDHEGRKLLTDSAVKLAETVREDDTLKAVVTAWPNERQYWSHVEHPRTNRPVYPETQETKLSEILHKCPDCENCYFTRKDLPLTFSWYMTNDINFTPSEIFKCFVDITCFTPTQQEVTHLMVEELCLREKDRRPHPESVDDYRFEDLTRFLTSMGDEIQEKFIETIKRKFDCRGARIRDIMEDLQRKMKPVGIYEATVATLQLGHMYKQLSDLQDRGIIPGSFFPRPIPRVGLDEFETRNRNFDRRSADPVEVCNRALNQSQMDRRRTDQGQTTGEVCNEISNQDNGTLNQYQVDTNGYARKATEAEGGIDDRHCRNELGSDLPVCSYDLQERNALAGFHGNHLQSDSKSVEMQEMREELFTQTVPQQEHASFDETDPKTWL